MPKMLCKAAKASHTKTGGDGLTKDEKRRIIRRVRKLQRRSPGGKMIDLKKCLEATKKIVMPHMRYKKNLKSITKLAKNESENFVGYKPPRNRERMRTSLKTQAMSASSKSGIDDERNLGFPVLVHDKFHQDQNGEYDFAAMRKQVLTRGFAVAAGVVSPERAKAAADALKAYSKGKELQVPGAGGCSLVTTFGLAHIKEVSALRCDPQLVGFCAKLWNVHDKTGPNVQFQVLIHAPIGYHEMPKERADTLRKILQEHGLCIPANVLQKAEIADLMWNEYMPHYENYVVVLECPVVGSLDCVAVRKSQNLDESTQTKMSTTIVDSENKFLKRANTSLKAHIDVNRHTKTPGAVIEEQLKKFALGQSIQGILQLGPETSSTTVLLPDHGLDPDFPRPEHMQDSKRDKVDMNEEFYAEYGQLFRSLRMSPGDYLVICSDTVHANQATHMERQALMVTYFPRGAYPPEQLETFFEKKKIGMLRGDTFTHWPGAKNGSTNSGGGHMSQKRNDPDAFQPLFHKEGQKKLQLMKKMSKNQQQNAITRELVQRYGPELYASMQHVL
jgi:hypothetical protein